MLKFKWDIFAVFVLSLYTYVGFLYKRCVWSKWTCLQGGRFLLLVLCQAERLEAAEFGRKATTAMNQKLQHAGSRQVSALPKIKFSWGPESQFVAAQKDVGLAGFWPWKQRPVLHAHCEQGEVDLQSTLISTVWANLSELSILVAYLKKTLLISESFWLQNFLYILVCTSQYSCRFRIPSQLLSHHSCFCSHQREAGNSREWLSWPVLHSAEWRGIAFRMSLFQLYSFCKKSLETRPIVSIRAFPAMLSDSIGMILIAVI